MPKPRHTGVLVIATVLATGAVGAYAAAGSGGTSQNDPLALSGSVSGLVPGARRTIEIQVTNPNGREVTVTDVAVGVTAERTGCPASALEVGHASTPLAVPASGSSTTTLPVTLAASAPDACQGASFALRYSATATGPDLPAGSPAQTPSGTPVVTPAAPKTKVITKTVYRTKRVCRITRRHHKRVKHCRKVRVKVRIKVRVPA
jgi:hypothetical protein